MTELRGITRRSVSEDVVSEILSGISTGKYAPGDRLPTEPELARQLGVGRTSVREGVGRLRMLGAVEVRRGLGTFITDHVHTDPRLAFVRWTTEHLYQIVDVFEVRISLETTAASLAATRATEEELALLEERADDHARAQLAGDLELLVKTDQAFHEALIACSHNEALAQVYGVLVPELIPYRKKSLALDGAPIRSSNDHRAIAHAIRCRQPSQAQAAALSHLSTLYAEIIKARDDQPLGI